MAKHNNGHRPDVKLREAPPKVKEDGTNVLIMCPFCDVPHPVSVGKQAACGTELRVTAVQTVIPARTVNKHKLVCFKCNQGGGEMVPFNQGFIHLIDCAPGTKLLAEPPTNFSRWASWVYNLPLNVRKKIEARTGVARKVEEIDPQGKPTGRTLGYLFYKGEPK